MDHNNSLRAALKAARKTLRWTQDNLAEKVGCSRSLIANIEGGVVPTEGVFQRIVHAFPEVHHRALRNTVEARQIIQASAPDGTELHEQDDEDMVLTFMSPRRSRQVDLSGQWNAIWLTTVNGQENRNREIVHARKRWNGSWELSNEAISEDNPDGGYLWIARLELFDNKHLLGYYCARDRAILAKGTLCLELQPNGREIVGVWDGLNFDTMWATGMVALCKSTSKAHDPEVALNRFISMRPKMPYNPGENHAKHRSDDHDNSKRQE